MTKAHTLPDDEQLAALASRIDRPLVLVGMMGVGKSSVGRKLAQLLGLGFADADDAIVEAAHMPISDIFDQFGEAHFRDGERRVIARLLDDPRQVVATGGGAFVQPDTRALILDRGIAIWLDADVDTLVERVGRSDKRPLLRGGNPRPIIEKLMAERTPAYQQAPIHARSERGPHSDTIANILEALGKWL
jgi:shikimate kinase